MISLFRPSDAYMHQSVQHTLVQIMACRLFGAKPLSRPMLPYCQLDPKEHISVIFYVKFKVFIQGNALKNVVCEMVAIFSRSQCVGWDCRCMSTCLWMWWYYNLNSFHPRQNGSHFADDIFRFIFLNENFFFFIVHWNLFRGVQLTITQH